MLRSLIWAQAGISPVPHCLGMALFAQETVNLWHLPSAPVVCGSKGCVMFLQGLKRVCLALSACLMLVSCASLDEEDSLRAELKKWLFLAQTKHFTSKQTCTIGVFELASSELRSTAPRKVTTFREALHYIRKDRAVTFDMPGVTPSEISEGVMSLDLSHGLGLVSAGVGPYLDCLEEGPIMNGFYAVLTSPEAVTIYSPAGNFLLMVYPPEAVALFMRGNV